MKLVDINPWRAHTNPLLFDWEYLEKEISVEDDNDASPEFRTVTSEDEAIIEDLSAYRVPDDMLDEHEYKNDDDELANMEE